MENKIEREKKKSSSGKGCLVFLVLAVIIGYLLLKPSTPTKKVVLITPEIKQEIKNIEKLASKYISITSIEESDMGYISVNVELLNEPTSYDEVRVWTDAVCKDIYKILKKHNINISIFVHARRHEGEDFIRMYGDTTYDHYSGKFTFKEAK